MLLPLHDQNPQLKPPVATYALIALNVLSWVFVQGLGGMPAMVLAVCDFGLIPAGLLSNPAAADGVVCVPDAGAGWITLFTSMFLHGGWLHLIGNLWFLWIFGDNVEDSMGSLRFFCFYLLCGVLAAAAHMVIKSDSLTPMIGASGAISGVMGAYIALYPRVKVTVVFLIVVIPITFQLPAMMVLGYWFAIDFIGGVSTIGHAGAGTAFWAHIGGFLAGLALVWWFKDDDLVDGHPYHGW